MSIAHPRIPEALSPAEDFENLLRQALEDEAPLKTVHIEDASLTECRLAGVDVRESVLENTVFRDSILDRASFLDVRFENCDFSNCRMVGAYFDRCQFVRCKCVGTDLHESIFRHVVWEESNLRYACLDQSKLTDACFRSVDFTEGSLSEAALKRFEAFDSRFIRNNFFKTALAGLDFSRNEFASPILSAALTELKGAAIDPYQAVELMGLLGVIVKS